MGGCEVFLTVLVGNQNLIVCSLDSTPTSPIHKYLNWRRGFYAKAFNRRAPESSGLFVGFACSAI